ncbi:DUF2165 family protein [Parasphingopyxis lamellibrachiae]|uniref:Putative small integral membrane protein n=1 Tax=Parasphingopyxis lamellibrachiae TaxID=680125 RepID=A0A3D9FF75_9SPHN|nr:DUF2165 family protein [Parasphingopyxis lamellibrachiae]RED15726.1 putative small integral membrane protein [Parasphingopyxis lamellibrachiae]
MIRIIKILLIVSVASWALLGAVENVVDWGGTTGAVAATVSMSTFEGGAESWKATSSVAVVTTGALLILLGKLIAGLFCLAGAWRMWSARASDAVAFQNAKVLALAGCGTAVLLLFAGWIVIAETWFELWRSEMMRDLALQSAFRYGAMIGVIALIVGARDD